jgi:hypothetical protein
MKTIVIKLAYLMLLGGFALSTPACAKKSFESINKTDDGSTSGGTIGGGTSGGSSGGTSGGSSGGTTSGGTSGGVTSGGTSGGSTSGGTTGGTTSGGTTGGSTSGGTTGGSTSGGTTGGSTSGGTTGGSTSGGMNGGSTSGGTTGGSTSGGTTGGSTSGGTTGGSCTPFQPGCDHDGRYCITEKYQQPNATITRKLDVWIITDSSSSMDAEREQLANGITNYISKMPAGTDVQFAVSLAHGPTSWFSGRLYKSDFKDPREKFVLSTSQYSNSEIQYWMRRKLLYRQANYSVRAWDDSGNPIAGQAVRNLPTDFDADGGEAGLFSAYEAIRPYSTAPSRYESIQNLAATNPGERGFFREDAALAVIFISDENDICYLDPSVADADGLEASFNGKYCSGITAQNVLQRLQVVRKSLPLHVSSIIYNNKANIPAGLENGVGLGYNQITFLAGGTVIDITKDSIASGLSAIGGHTSTRLDLRYEFIAKYKNVDPSTLQAKVDGTRYSHSYSGATNTVHLQYAGGANSLVDIYYCLTPSSPLDPYNIQISTHLINTCRKAYQPNVVIEQP